jgi:hypothetical protein
MGQGVSVADQARDARALTLLWRSIEILRPFGAAATEDPRPRQRLTEALWETARLLRQTGVPGEVDGLDAERRALWRDKPPGDLASLAMEETREAARVGYGRLPLGGPVAVVRQIDLDLAAENLRLAVARGFRDLAALRKERDSWLLLTRVDVRPMVGEMGFPDDPLQPASGSK